MRIRRRSNERAAARGKPFVRTYESHERLQREREELRDAGVYLASTAELPGGAIRAVWVGHRRYEIVDA
jgi:hypothetical protein